MNHTASPAQSRSPLARELLASAFWILLWLPLQLLVLTGMRAAVPIRVLALLLPLAVLALVLPKVGYRSRDALFLLIPIWGIRFSWTVSRRLASLPHIDWPVRDDHV